MDTNYLYVVQMGYTGPIHVGHVQDISTRLRALQQANPYPLRVLVAVEAPEPVFLALQESLASDALHGGWFEWTREAKALISEFSLADGAFQDYIRAFTFLRVPALPDSSELRLEIESIANQIHQSYLAQEAPICLVVHNQSGLLDSSLHLLAPNAAAEARALVNSPTTQRPTAVCFYHRDLDPGSPQWRQWRLVRSAGVCPGGCHSLLP